MASIHAYKQVQDDVKGEKSYSLFTIYHSLRPAFAFTLAEVLITLGIIGVVAAITIPTLMNKIQGEQYKAALRANYSIISQAFTTMLSEHSGTAENVCSTGDYACLRDLMGNYLTFIKKCNGGEAGCWMTDKVKYLYNFGGASYENGSPTAVLKNGAAMLFQYGDSTCSSHWFSQTKDFTICGVLEVDVNGLQKPNTVGRDMFYFWILKNKIVPFGTQGDIYDGRNGEYCDENKNFSPNGYSCGAKYLIRK